MTKPDALAGGRPNGPWRIRRTHVSGRATGTPVWDVYRYDGRHKGSGPMRRYYSEAEAIAVRDALNRVARARPTPTQEASP